MSEEVERWFAYLLKNNSKCLYCAYANDTERIKALNERLTAGGCVFTHAGICTAAANKAWFDMGKRMSPLDFSKYKLILDDKEPTIMKITTQEHSEDSLLDLRRCMEFDLVDGLCPELGQFLSDNYECVEDIFQGNTIIYILYPDKAAAAKLQAFVESGAIDGYLSDARWVKVEDRYWLALNFKENK